ncbi:hypothetical protein [uncultured Bacteroides sp.]|uniref:hypothetical protein n=1 Tax=uncultured Bacteroides sp. TaxID=162156 RepID=UPI002AA75057|nr:hypothetical protein [uncultured Bacteroides sp.]
MKIKILGITLFSLLMVSCASMPKETVTLSKTIGSDLQILHDSHRNMVQLYYSGMKVSINTFIDDVYAPFVIHHVLESELDKYKKGESSLYGIIESAGKIGGKKETEEALNIMMEFQEAANEQIATKRNELLSPIESQEKEILGDIDQYYQNTIYANATLTAYLISAHKVKESQNEALSIIGLSGMDTTVTNRLIELSGLVDTAIEKGKKLDVKNEKAQQEIENIVNTIKNLTNKTTR